MLNEEVALTELEIYETKLEELDLEAALNTATSAISNAAAFWNQCSSTKNSGFKEFCFQVD